MATYSIPDAAEFTGEWTVPDGEAHIAGTLSWSSQRATLQLHDTFKPLRGAVYASGDVQTYPAIHGTTLNSELVSILSAMRSKTGFSFGHGGARQTESIISSAVVVGAHVTPATRYSELSLRIPGLPLWLGRSGARLARIDKAPDTVGALEYRIDLLDEEVVEIPSVGLKIGWGIEVYQSGDLLTAIDVKMHGWLRLMPAEPQNLDWYLKQFGKVMTLMSFLCGSPMAPDRVTGKTAEGASHVEVLIALREAKYCRHRHIHDFFMLRGAMDVELGPVLVRWFDLYDTIAMPSQLALSVLSSEGLWLHVEFLSLMQALEGFHRATMDGTYLSEEGYKPIATALTVAIPAGVATDHKTALKSRIKYGNEVSLRRRLNELVRRLDESLRRTILGGDGTVPGRWVDTRNYYTHWGDELKESTLDGADMHRAGVRMRILLRALYLDLVGVPQSAIAMSLHNTCNDSQYLLQLNAADHRQRDPASEAGALLYVNVKDTESPDEASA